MRPEAVCGRFRFYTGFFDSTPFMLYAQAWEVCYDYH